MNHDPTPTSPADLDPNSNRHDDNTADDDHGSPSNQPNGSATDNQRRQPKLSKKAKSGLNKKLAFVLHLLMSLDALVYAELCVLYYMDCSFFRLLIRWVPHWLFLSVKPDVAIVPYFGYPVSAIIGPNIFCMFLHLVTSLPHASEISRGYLHGGVLVDFIGQKAPTSKLSLLLIDIMVLGLQCFSLAVNLEKDRIKKIVSPPRQPAGTAGSSVTAPVFTQTGQDHDHEERGVLRDTPRMDETDDIELMPLRNDAGEEERTALLERRNSSREELRDVLSSGNAILADYNVRGALRRAWTDRGNTAEAAGAYTLQNVSYNATLAALAAQRRAGFTAAQTNAARRP